MKVVWIEGCSEMKPMGKESQKEKTSLEGGKWETGGEERKLGKEEEEKDSIFKS